MSHHECCCGCNDNREAVRENAKAALTPEIVAFIEECAADAHPESQLIRVLHRVQGHYGHLGREQMDAVAQLLQVPASKVTGVATFYHFFKFKPKGKHTVTVCMGTACYVRGAGKLLEDVAESLHVKVGETTQDGLYTLEACRCLGVCSQAPAVMIDEDVVGKVSLKTFMHALKDYQ